MGYIEWKSYERGCKVKVVDPTYFSEIKIYKY